MKKILFSFLPFVLIVLVLNCMGCQPAVRMTPTSHPTDQLPTATLAVHSLSQDKTIVCGYVIHSDRSPLINLNIRLAEVYYGQTNAEGAFVLNTSTSPSAMTDSNGYFCTAEIPVTDYVLIIGNPEDNYEIYAGENQKPMTWSPSAGKVLDIGEIITNLEP